MLSREAILGHKDTNIGRVSVDEFGGEVCVAMFSAAEADRFRSAIGETTMPMNVLLVILGACDEKGERLFTDADAEALGKQPAKALTTIANKVLEHNGLTGDAVEEAKNASSETEDDASDSASPSPSEKPSKS